MAETPGRRGRRGREILTERRDGRLPRSSAVERLQAPGSGFRLCRFGLAADKPEAGARSLWRSACEVPRRSARSATRPPAGPRGRRRSRRAPPARGSRRVPSAADASAAPTGCGRSSAKRWTRRAAAALDVFLIEDRQAALAILPHRFDERQVGRRARAPAAQAALVCGTRSSRGRSATRSMPNSAAAAGARAQRRERGGEIPLAQQRLQHAVGRHHERRTATACGTAARGCRRERGDAPRQAGRGARRCRARASIGAERSMPTSRHAGAPERHGNPPGAASELEHRPATRTARSRQNGTSRRPMVRAFSQS